MRLKRPVVFVGEKRSLLAQARNVTWEDKALASKTLHDALAALGYHGFVNMLNLWTDDGRERREVVIYLRHKACQGHAIVAMGRTVQTRLRTLGVPCVPMIHPAARGPIRARARYQAHVAEVLRLAGVL